MRHRSSITASATFCLALSAATAQAQIGSSCLRPLGIPDKWIENQTPPWDPTDTFDPTGPNPDVYLNGYDPVEDQGRPMSLVLYNRIDPPQGQSAWPIVVSAQGAGLFQDAIAGCSGYLHFLGESFRSHTGNPDGPFHAGIRDLISRDPDAVWDPQANDGRGGVIGSGYPQSPRIIALPVFPPPAYEKSSSTADSPAMVKIVGFFVSYRTEGAVHGYLTGLSELALAPVSGRMGDWVQLSATFTGPGSPVVGLPIEFLVENRVVATAETDGTGAARPPTMSFRIEQMPGSYPGAIRARLGGSPTFFTAQDALGDLSVLRKLPQITWAPPADITYGTPLGPQQLNASADTEGEFSYLPAAGAVLTAKAYQPLTVSFVPANSKLYEETTASTYVSVEPAPLVVKVNDAGKLYLDPLPAFSFTVTGLVNGDSPSFVFGSTNFQTRATPSSPVGTYPVWLEGSIGAENYSTSVSTGTLFIAPRPTATLVQSTTPSSSTYGQAVVVTVTVSSGVGMPSGMATLLRGDVPVAAGALINGQATLSVTTLNAGAQPLSVAYGGAEGFEPSSSPVFAHTVNRASTTTQLATSLNPSRSGQAVTLTATVGPVAPGAGQPLGSVQFLRGTVVLATVPLTGGSAQFTTTALVVGRHAIQARYVDTDNYAASASAVLQQTVKGGGK